MLLLKPQKAIEAITLFLMFIDRVKYNPYIPYILRFQIGEISNRELFWSIFRNPLLIPYDYFYSICEDVNGKLHVLDQVLDFKGLIEGIYEGIVEKNVDWRRKEVREKYRRKYPGVFKIYDDRRKVYSYVKREVSADRRRFILGKDGYFNIELVYNVEGLPINRKLDIIFYAIDSLRKAYENVLGRDYLSEIRKMSRNLNRDVYKLLSLRKLVNAAKKIIENLNNKYLIEEIAIFNDSSSSTIRIFLKKMGRIKETFHAEIYEGRGSLNWGISLSLYIASKNYREIMESLKSMLEPKLVFLSDYYGEKRVEYYEEEIKTLNNAVNTVIKVFKNI